MLWMHFFFVSFMLFYAHVTLFGTLFVTLPQSLRQFSQVNLLQI